MTIRRIAFALVPLCLLFFLAAPSPAPAEEAGTFTGQFLIGFRTVDVGGSNTKYREDYNLDDGPRLFDLNLHLIPDGSLRSFADRVHLDMSNLGGDPFETISLGVEKFGSYNFRFDRRESDYFYSDIILPKELAGDPAIALAGDFHTFDFRRVRDTASLDITLSSAAKLTLGFERFTRTGEGTTTLDIQRDEFELDKPIDESLNAYNVGFQYDWDRVTVVLEERIRDYENAVEIFLPGFSRGEDPLDASNLDFYFLNQPYDFTSMEHTVRVLARPNSRFNIRAAASLQDMDLNVKADERSQGTTFTGAPFSDSASGEGGVNRDIELFDLDLSYLINERISVVAGGWSKNLDQDGDFRFDGDLGLGGWEIDTQGGEVGLQVGVSSTLQVTGGVRWESRDVNQAFSEGVEEPLELGDTESTDHTGYFAAVAWHPLRACSLTLEFEDSSYDDPFTLASPTDRQRVRFTGRYTLTNGLSVSGVYLLNSYENNNSGWDSDVDQGNIRLGYNREGLSLSFGYGFIEIDRAIDQLVVTAPGFGGGVELPFDIAYKADADFYDFLGRWELDHRWAVGGSARWYENDGSFGLKRTDLKAYVEAGIATHYVVRVGYRTVDYDETATNFDDYDADIAEFAIGYRW